MSADVQSCVAPVGLRLPADQPVPIGYLRVSDDRVVALRGFVGDLLGSMASNNLDGTASLEMQLAVAAAAFVEICGALSPGLRAVASGLCFPDDGTSLPLGSHVDARGDLARAIPSSLISAPEALRRAAGLTVSGMQGGAA